MSEKRFEKIVEWDDKVGDDFTLEDFLLTLLIANTLWLFIGLLVDSKEMIIIGGVGTAIGTIVATIWWIKKSRKVYWREINE